MIIILGSIVNIIGGELYYHSMNSRILTSIMNYIRMSSKNYEESGGIDLDLLTILY